MSRSVLLLLLAAGCADSIKPDPGQPDAGMPSGDIVPTGKVTTVRGSDTTYRTLIDSTSLTDWTYVDFETGGELAASGAWDLRFQRFHISTNGGVSGSGGVEIAPVAGTPFAAVAAAPTTGFLSDLADSDADGEPEYALDQGDSWYDYNSTTHALTPRPLTWVVKTAGGATIKLEIVKYYDTAGTAAWFTLHWATL